MEIKVEINELFKGLSSNLLYRAYVELLKRENLSYLKGMQEKLKTEIKNIEAVGPNPFNDRHN